MAVVKEKLDLEEKKEAGAMAGSRSSSKIKEEEQWRRRSWRGKRVPIGFSGWFFWVFFPFFLAGSFM